MNNVMDQATAEHCYAWLEREIREDEQHAYEQAVHEALRQEPALVEEGKTWEQIARYGFAALGN